LNFVSDDASKFNPKHSLSLLGDGFGFCYGLRIGLFSSLLFSSLPLNEEIFRYCWKRENREKLAKNQKTRRRECKLNPFMPVHANQHNSDI